MAGEYDPPTDAEVAASNLMDRNGIPLALATQARYILGWRSRGVDPVASAEHMIKLRKALADGV